MCAIYITHYTYTYINVCCLEIVIASHGFCFWCCSFYYMYANVLCLECVCVCVLFILLSLHRFFFVVILFHFFYYYSCVDDFVFILYCFISEYVYCLNSLRHPFSTEFHYRIILYYDTKLCDLRVQCRFKSVEEKEKKKFMEKFTNLFIWFVVPSFHAFSFIFAHNNQSVSYSLACSSSLYLLLSVYVCMYVCMCVWAIVYRHSYH